MKQKILAILLPALLGFLGFFAGSTITQMKFKKTPLPQATPKVNETTKGEQNIPPKEQEAGYETYVVAEGDTLFDISLKFKVSQDELAKLNGISDLNQIKAGQILKIPKPGTALSETKIEIDLAKMEEIQVLVDQGEQLWRLEPVEVVKAESPASFEFTALDVYTLQSKDESIGEAKVLVKKTEDAKVGNFEVELIQPVKKGEEGIWAVSLIKEIKT